MTGGILWYARRRPAGAPLTWGEAMVGAVYVFFLLLLVYGVVPHLWLSWADNELRWRPDKLFAVPRTKKVNASWHWPLPLTLSYQTLRDFIVAGIYGGFVAGTVAMWSVWQNRGKKVVREIVRSEYGRPLVKEEA
jgi:hypothetical protein